jgi:hypothetical protein
LTRSDEDRTILIEADGHLLACAEIYHTDVPGLVHSEMHVESGHLPGGTRARLVDAVLDSPEMDRAERLLATMPIGDVEMLERVRQRCDDVEARAAGATKLVDARLEHRIPRPR